MVNPFDVDALAAALHTALTMPEDERRARMSALRDRVRGNNVHAWVRGFVQQLDVAAQRARQATASPAQEVQRALSSWLAERPTTALFFDYDGTLTPLAPHPRDAVLPDAAREALRQAARTPQIDLVIVSGRALADVQAMVGVPGLTYVGNHGFQIEGPGISFRHAGADEHEESITRAADDLAQLEVPGAWVERKGTTLTFHVRQVPEAGKADVQKRARAVLRRHGLRVVSGHEAVEGRPRLDWDKGRAVLHVLKQRHGADWPSRVRAVYLGDDATDEDAFRSLKGIGRSVCVTKHWRESAAEYRLPDPAAVLQLLRWLASGAFVSTT